MKTPNDLGCCTTPRPDCMGMLIDGIGDRCQALRMVSEGTESAQRINKTIPLKSCAPSGCNYPQGDCLGVCS